VHALDWMPGLATVGEPIAPEMERLPKVPLQCLYGAGDNSLCPALNDGRTVVGAIGKGHHFGGDYDEVADRVLEFSRRNAVH
jgi:type IV secretory pathway VirJ component